MIQSMTGYGKVTDNFQGKTVSVEIKSLNSKSLDLYTRIVPFYREKEIQIRQLVFDKLNRGKIDLNINIENTGVSKNTEINKELAAAYFNDLKVLDGIIGKEPVDYHTLILRMPDIFVQTNETLEEAETAFLMDLVSRSCDNLINFRTQEGNALKTEFTEKIEEIRRLLAEVEPFEAARIETVRERIHKNLDEMLAAQVDENRFQQELIFYLEKLDVSEEKMRLANHLDYFLETMSTEFPGKKLGFIAQEIGREVNTLGSKANHVEMQKLVVEMKDNLEKIKEQVLNTL
ncbi:MAG: YicC/YloC family endoribonuclease [Bacteroidota bacterium]